MAEQLPGSRPFHKLNVAVIASALALTGAVGYGIHERSVADRLSSENQQTTAALNQTRSQIDAMSSRLDSMIAAENARRQTKESAAVVERSGKRTVAHRRRAEDPRWKKVQAQLDEQGKAIQSTRDDLTNALSSTKTELQGSIARTHGELVALQKKGERNYYEFDIPKSKQFQREGPVGLRLRKANNKHQYADLELLVDDVQLQKKHVNLYEPVMFYPAGTNQPLELVINRVSKDHIHGYVSTPKYTAAELAAMTASSDNAADSNQQASNNPPAQRQKLTLPKEQ